VNPVSEVFLRQYGFGHKILLMEHPLPFQKV